MLKIKRIYDKPEATDGYRILVDRLWPRGLSKDRTTFDLWLKDIAPSNELRVWFGHKPERFEEFQASYQAELKGNPAVNALLNIIKKHKDVCLLYSAHDPEHNQAVVLREYLRPLG